MPKQRVIRIHPSAPPKPALGQPCNGCGACCLLEPCPVGIWASRRRTGACKALVWSEDAGLYRCGMLDDPLQRLGWPAPSSRWGRRCHDTLQAWLRRWCRRWIAAGAGCDADLRVEAADPPRD
ncbi:MAG: hypothetical protein JOY60_07755 [Burkholderiaceae bacterium]|nr:hypothetical protein [Roseateles sp.]MBV8469736.1 hypothetical protein [Burkholderiaceae bacterium]